MIKKTPNPVDIHVGSRVRLRRMLIGLSQDKLGEELGLTFQQVQKYEKGTNRIGASRLWQIAKILGVPVQFFFEDLSEPDAGGAAAAGGFAEADAETPVFMDFISSNEGMQLNKYFPLISDMAVRKRIVDLVRSLADEEARDRRSAAAMAAPAASEVNA
ncbi:MAG: helix-turn-helix transcriptional regulator [Pseudomonadota bacterium]